MQSSVVVDRGRANGFGFIRLLLASLVIVAHTPELADGNRSREILTRIFGTISFGEFAVDGFFVLSGFFIAGSYLKSPSVGDYLLKRIARIYPAFIVAWLFCVLCVAPLAGAITPVGLDALVKMIPGMLHLRLPEVQGAFADQPYPALNGAMWTIQFEFRCYLVVLMLGMVGLLRGRIAPFIIGLGLFAANAAVLYDPTLASLIAKYPAANTLLGDPGNGLRLYGCFMVGVGFYCVRDLLQFTRHLAAVAVVGMTGALIVPSLANAGVAFFGGYLALYAGRAAAGTVFERINNKSDISYGVYLYAWPVGQLILLWFPSAPLFTVASATFLVASAAGWASWHCIEKQVLGYAHLDLSKLPGQFVAYFQSSKVIYRSGR